MYRLSSLIHKQENVSLLRVTCPKDTRHYDIRVVRLIQSSHASRKGIALSPSQLKAFRQIVFLFITRDTPDYRDHDGFQMGTNLCGFPVATSSTAQQQ